MYIWRAPIFGEVENFFVSDTKCIFVLQVLIHENSKDVVSSFGQTIRVNKGEYTLGTSVAQN